MFLKLIFICVRPGTVTAVPRKLQLYLVNVNEFDFTSYGRRRRSRAVAVRQLESSLSDCGSRYCFSPPGVGLKGARVFLCERRRLAAS